MEIGTKDGNEYPLSACPRVKNLLGTGSGMSLYPRVRVAFDIRRYLQNGYIKVVSIPDTEIPADMWGHMLDNIYSLGFTEGTPPHSVTPRAHHPPILCLPQHQIHHQPFFPSPHADAGRGPGPPPANSSHYRPSAAAADPSPRDAGPSSCTVVGVGAPPPDAGPPPVVHPPPALLKISWRPKQPWIL
jgi:hypothetical protein